MARALERKLALITGASGGFGAELSRIFAKNQYNLVIVARQTRKLEELKGELESKYRIKVYCYTSDLSQEREVLEFCQRVKKDGHQVDTLVNNAGFGHNEPFASTDLNITLDLINVNITALTILTHFFVNEMLKNGQGRILNVASIAAFYAGPFLSSYNASKAYVLYFSEGLSSELRGKNIQVSVVCPGVMGTGFFSTAKMNESWFVRLIMEDPRKIAELTYRKFEKGRKLIIPGIANNLIILGAKFSARPITHEILRLIQKK